VSLILVFRVPDMIRIPVNCRMALAAGCNYPFQIITLKLVADYTLTIYVVSDMMSLQKEL